MEFPKSLSKFVCKQQRLPNRCVQSTKQANAELVNIDVCVTEFCTALNYNELLMPEQFKKRS
jgi:hypothetical protein